MYAARHARSERRDVDAPGGPPMNATLAPRFSAPAQTLFPPWDCLNLAYACWREAVVQGGFLSILGRKVGQKNEIYYDRSWDVYENKGHMDKLSRIKRTFAAVMPQSRDILC